MAAKAPDSRPSAVGFVDGLHHPVRCHWQAEAYAGLCAEVLAGIGLAWDVQVGEMGWPPPIPDDDGILDVYISTDGDGGAYAYGPWADAIADDDRMGTFAHIVVDPAFEDWMAETMFHEFNHVLQYGIDLIEPRYVPWEATATAAEVWTDPSVQIFDEYVTDFQATPWVGLLGDGYQLWDAYEIWSYYEYGAALWLLYLDAVAGDGFGLAGLELWLGNAQEGWVNEPDFLDASGLTTGDWVDDWMAFSVARTAVGTAFNPSWALGFEAPEFGIGLDHSLSVAALPASVSPSFAPYQTGVVYIKLKDLALGTHLVVDVTSADDTRFGLLAAAGGVGEWQEGSVFSFEASASEMVVGVVNLGTGDFDADDPMVVTELVISIAEVEPPPPDKEEAIETEWTPPAPIEAPGENKGGCAQISASPVDKMLWILGIVGVLLPRCRASNRKG